MPSAPRKISLSALLPSAAIVVPAALLAVLGWRAYRAEALVLRDRYQQDQAAIVRLVGARLSEEAKKNLDDLLAEVRRAAVDEALEARFLGSHPLARHVFVVRGGRLVYPSASPTIAAGDRDRDLEGGLLLPSDVRRYINRLRARRRLRAVFARGLRAEYAGQLGAAARQYRVAAARTAQPSAAALLGLARIQRRQGRREEAVASYELLQRRFARLRDEEGVSYALLAAAGRAEVIGRDALLALHERLLQGEYATSPGSRRFYLRWTLQQLTAARPPVPPATLARLRQRNDALFASDRFGRVLRRYGVSERQLASGEVAALSIAPGTLLVARRQANVLVGYALDEAILHHRLAALERKLLPSGHGVQLKLRRSGEPSDGRPVVVHTTTLEAPLGHFTLVASRTAGDPIVELERSGQLRYFGMVAGLVLVLAAGLLFMYRGVRREQELARLKSDFASNVSHELKTPLTSIRMYAEMLRENIAATADDQQRYHEVIIRESERLGRLIANVLDFSRVERGTRRYDVQREDLHELASEAVETFRRLTADEPPAIDFAAVGGGAEQAADDGAFVWADREAAIQSLLNLLGNAAKYSRGRPEIHVRFVRGDGERGIAVSDRGIGIPPAEQKRIFDDFYRAPQAREVGVEGTGLGLALVRRHMAAYGGRVEVSSALGEGSTFTLWFRPAEQQEDAFGEDTGHRG